MTHTAIGIFSTEDQAKRAISKLVESGFREEYISLTSQRKVEYNSDPLYDEQQEYRRELREYFSKIFNNAEDVERYSVVAANGVVVSVQADNYGQAARAAELLDECGTVHVESKAESLRHGYEEYDRLNTVDDRDDRTGRYPTPSANTTREKDHDSPATRPASITETITTRRSYIVESPLSSDVHKETHIRIEENEEGGSEKQAQQPDL